MPCFATVNFNYIEATALHGGEYALNFLEI
jgi:hypothetical protein